MSFILKNYDLIIRPHLFFFKLSSKEFSIWYIKSMAEIGLWTDVEKFTQQKGVIYY